MSRKASLLLICVFIAVLSCSCVSESGTTTFHPAGHYDIKVTEVTFFSFLGNKNMVKISSQDSLVSLSLSWKPASISEGTCINIVGVSDYLIIVPDYQVQTSDDFVKVDSIYLVKGSDRYLFSKI